MDGPKRILIVEDELLFAQDLSLKLEANDFHVVGIAESGEQALKLAADMQPDLVLMDIRIKGPQDGITTAQTLEARYGMPVVYLTAYADEATLARAGATSPFGYVVKPVEEQTLVACIRIALNRYEMELRIREGEEWLRSTLSSIGDAVIAVDAEGRVRTLNPRAQALLGGDASGCGGEMLADVLQLQNPFITEEPLVEKLLELREPLREPQRLVVRAAEEGVPVRLFAAPIFASGERRVGTVLVLHDLRDEEEMQRRLLEREEELQRNFFLLDESFRSTIRTMAKLVEVRDPYTAGHQRRVADLARLIGERLRLSSDIVETIFMAGLIHDIGKIRIPSEILSKPGRLSDVEMWLIRTHPETGNEILQAVAFPWPLQKVILQHHERLDGSGYPLGLKGEEICIEPRVLAVADVVEAMHSHRPYRAALGVESALAEIERHAGVLYDQNVVRACVDLFNEGFHFRLEDV